VHIVSLIIVPDSGKDLDDNQLLQQQHQTYNTFHILSTACLSSDVLLAAFTGRHCFHS
jgi:hypothetical protein